MDEREAEDLNDKFQSTRPRGARPVLMLFCNLISCFNPRAHGGRDMYGERNMPMMPGFNPRAHGGRDPATCGVTDNVLTFQSTRPRGARQFVRSVLAAHGGFQSTRPRGARHPPVGMAGFPQGVSIHAPTGGATPHPLLSQLGMQVSIHAPTGGATEASPMDMYDSGFQSTRPRGARPALLPLPAPLFCFNPRAHGGRDGGESRGRYSINCFNPRAHGGRDG